jgi:predicted  nucleic acid-binding Zn-ribbon protein
MRIATFLCIAFCIAGTFADPAQDAADRAKLEELSKTQFGKTILDTIQLQLASGDPMDDLIELLREIYNFVLNEQNDDDEYIKGIRGQCDSEIGRLRTEISAADDRARELNDEINEKTPIRDEKVELLAEKRELLAETGDRIIELDEEKAEHDADWAAEQAEHDRATYVIERAKEVIENGFGGSFLQKTFKPQTLVQVAEHFKTNSKNFKRNSWNHVFKLLAQIASSNHVQADAGAVERILHLIDALLERIAESREIERREYEAWVAEYTEAREAQVSLYNTTESQIENLENEISALTKRINNATAERDEQRERSRQKNIELTGRIKWCDDEADGYADRRADRTERLTVVSETIALVERNIRVLKDFVNQRLG